jgi:hypothetical protein
MEAVGIESSASEAIVVVGAVDSRLWFSHSGCPLFASMHASAAFDALNHSSLGRAGGDEA